METMTMKAAWAPSAPTDPADDIERQWVADEAMIGAAPESARAELAELLNDAQTAECDGDTMAPALRSAFHTAAVAAAGKGATDTAMGAESAGHAAESGLIDQMVKLAGRGRDVNTSIAFRIGKLAQQVKDLNHAAMPSLPRGGKDGTAAPALRRVWSRLTHECPWIAKGGHITEYVKVYHLKLQLGDDTPTIGRLSFDVLRVLASCVAHNEMPDTFAIKESVEVGDKKSAPAPYRGMLVNVVAELSAAPKSAKDVRAELRSWEADIKKSAMSARDLKRLENEAKADELAKVDAERTAFLSSIAKQAAKLGIDNGDLEAKLVKDGIIAERVVMTTEGEHATVADPAAMSIDELAEFVRLLIQTEDDSRIGAVFQPLARYTAARMASKRGAVSSVKPALNDSPGVNVAA